MTNLISLEFLAALLMILNLTLILLMVLVIRRVSGLARRQAAMTPDQTVGQNLAAESASEVLALLEPLAEESREAAMAFESLIREKRKITKDLNEALDSRIISINLLLSRAAAIQKQMDDQQQLLQRSMVRIPAPSPLPRQPDVIDQQNQILDLYQNQMDVDTIAERLSIPKGEVQLVVDLKEKFLAMERAK